MKFVLFLVEVDQALIFVRIAWATFEKTDHNYNKNSLTEGVVGARKYSELNTRIFDGWISLCKVHGSFIDSIRSVIGLIIDSI